MNTKQALQYVRNTGDGATKADFIKDHEPIGEILWQELRHKLYVYEDMNIGGNIALTDLGNAELDGNNVGIKPSRWRCTIYPEP